MDTQQQLSLCGVSRGSEGLAYGTHTVDDYGQTCAFEGDSIDPDEYVGREVTTFANPLGPQ